MRKTPANRGIFSVFYPGIILLHRSNANSASLEMISKTCDNPIKGGVVMEWHFRIIDGGYLGKNFRCWLFMHSRSYQCYVYKYFGE